MGCEIKFNLRSAFCALFLLLSLNVKAGTYGASVEESAIKKSYPWAGSLIRNEDNYASKNNGNKEQADFFQLTGEQCEKRFEVTGEDSKGRDIQRHNAQNVKLNKCAALYLAQKLKEEFESCKLPKDAAVADDFVLQEDCLCGKEKESFSGLLSALAGRVSGKYKLTAAPWSECLAAFPKEKQARANQIAHQVYLDLYK